jgi:RsiW-degrading membrane proteinase PrsW (M82 family)
MNILLLPQRNSAEILLLPAPRPVSAKWHFLAPLIALAGGAFGILAAAYTEFLHGSLLVAFIGAPMIEEALKPLGVYLILAKWPRSLRNRFYTAFLAALSGIAFGIIENLVYLNIFIEEPSRQVILWRYSAGLSIHTLCSFIFGLGINQKLAASVKGEIKFLSYGKRFFVTAMVLHSLYNISVTVLATRLGWFE